MSQTDATGFSSVLRRVEKSSDIQRVIQRIERGAKRVDLAGLHGSSPAFVAEIIRHAFRRPIIVCCPNEEAAEDAYSDLCTVSAGTVQLFPEKDIFPRHYEARENLTVRGKRNACLDRVLRQEVDVVVTSFAGFLEKTTPVAVLKEKTTTIGVGQRIEIDDLCEHLVATGYEANHTVEELGQFAVRGAIVDVFDPSWAHPARLEFFDDEVVSIRDFDLDSQRALDKRQEIRLLPATAIFVTDAVMDNLRRVLADKACSKESIEQIAHEIEHHRFSYLLKRYAPVMGMDGSILDFFEDTAPIIFFWDEDEMSGVLDSLAQEIDRQSTQAEDDYPILEVLDYVHEPEYFLRHNVTSLYHRGLAASRVEKQEPATDSTDTIVFRTQKHPSILSKIDALVQLLRKYDKKGIETQIFSESAAQRDRLADMLDEDEFLAHLSVGWVTSGFVWDEVGLAILTDHEIFHRMLPRPADKRKTRRTQGYRHDHLQVGDFVVHVDYGIGRFTGLEKITAEGRETECLSLRYHGTDRIFVPVDQMPLVEKYVGKEGAVPHIDRLGGSRWQRTKERTKKALENVAHELLQVYAEREIASGHAFKPDEQWQRALEASFPFEETPDQLRATAEIKEDLESARPMERLVCGDVGFGKTEVAIRAAFKVASEGKQVAVLVPTTVLALQHFKTFSERVEAFPIKVEMLSRFRTAAEQKEIIKEAKAGNIDILIGTHRLLSKDLVFRDIGLLIIDEEHRFGVRSKEKLKRLRKSVDVLTLTATPIPRTLYMALAGIRGISVIDTPPRNRHPVKTEVLPFDEDTIVRAINAERKRDGQVFFVHNRVESILSMKAFLERLIPDIRVGVGHGQMGEKDLEKVIVGFLERKFDVLLSTTIIESGLDFPNVNTIIINRADRFGLAELYQLRGRVGRRERQAFAYLLVPRNFNITQNAGRRLQAMEEFEELGSGYRLAMRDLEIRGCGNVLGLEQHGQMVAVGFDLYCKMLKEAVEKIQGTVEPEPLECRIDFRVSSFLPEDYVEDQNERMTFYKRLGRLEDVAAVDDFGTELADRYGRLPVPARNLIDLTRLKLQGLSLGVSLIQLRSGRIVIDFHPEQSLPVELCAELVETFGGRVLFKTGDTFGLTLTLSGGLSPLSEAKKLLKIAVSYDKTYTSPDKE